MHNGLSKTLIARTGRAAGLMSGFMAALVAVNLTAAVSPSTPKTLAAVPVSPANALGVSVSGHVTLPNGTVPVPTGTFVWLRHPDPATALDFDVDIRGRSTVDPATGAFSFVNVEPGNYIIRAVPPQTSTTYGPSYVMPVQVFTQAVTSLVVPLTAASVTGTVYAPASLNAVHAIVHVYHGLMEVERRWTATGNFALGGLVTGTYQLRAEPWPDDYYWWSAPQAVHIQPSTSQFVSLTLTAPRVFGTVLQGPHTPVPVYGARVDAVETLGPIHVLRTDVTGPAGHFAIGDLPPGGATLILTPPPGRSALLPPPPITVTVPHATPITLTFDVADKHVFGWVRTNDGISVTNAVVAASRVGRYGFNETTTDTSGTYSLTLAPGLWEVKVHAISTTTPSNWVLPSPARTVQFNNTRQSETRRANFTVLTADASVAGAVQLPGGAVPPFTVTVALHTDEGIGVEQPLDVSGHYAFTVPHGVYMLDLHVHSTLFAAPPTRWVFARPLTLTVVPTITLLARDAIIIGTLTDETSTAVPDIPVVIWNPDTHATFDARSGPDGVYITTVYSGTWLVRPAPEPDQPYVYTGDPATVSLTSGQIAGHVDFMLTTASATIHGTLLDNNGNAVSGVEGWARAESQDGSVHTGAPVVDSAFDILVPAGTYSVNLQLPAGEDYMASRLPQIATIGTEQTTTVTFTLLPKDALIWGALLNVRTGTSPAQEVDGAVWARDQNLWTATDIQPSGLYTLPVAAGLWRVNYAIDPESNFVKAVGPRSYGVQSGQKQYVPLPVVRKDGLLTGTVVLTDGVTPAVGAVVIAEGISHDIEDVTLRAPVHNDGSFSLPLPSGLYRVRSTLLHNPGLINPALRTVLIPHNGSNNIVLQYRVPDASITGTVTLSGSPPLSGTVHLWAWSDDDGYSTSTAPVGGIYTLPVLSGHTWHVVAVFETRSKYWIARALVPVPATSTSVTQNLVLAGPKLKPAPVSVVFDPANDEYLKLGDGTSLFIPAGAIPATGRVLLNITPLAAAPHHRNGDVLGFSYAFEAYTEDGQLITQNFNQDVVITFEYDPAQLHALGLNVDHLKPAYFSTTTDSWTAPDSFVVDEDQHEISMQIDHFTNFSLITVSGTNQLFVPVAQR